MNTRKVRSRFAVCGLLAGALALVACGDDGDGGALPDGAAVEAGGGGTDATVDAPAPSGDGAAPTDGATGSDVAAPRDDAGIANCTGLPNGTPCGDGQICVANRCVGSSCGDGFVDESAGEECEDGNAAGGDGCSDCRFDCHNDNECSDAETCNGTETCDKSMPGKRSCKAGTPVAGGTACTLAVGGAGTCSNGACVKAGCGNKTVEAGEECDDMNADDTDGCKKDCTFTCKVPADCDDGNACNGAETCNMTTHTCTPGTAKVCMVGSCAGTCVAPAGTCKFPDVDMDGAGCDIDCNDADPAMFPGGYECADGKDNDCSNATMDTGSPGCECYVDKDKDTYAASLTGAITSAGNCPEGYTRRKPVDAASSDCSDNVFSANPAQTMYFTKGYCSGPFLCLPAALSFDYNCNKQAEQEFAKLSPGACTGAKNFTDCSARTGWISAIPKCGDPGMWRQCTWGRGTGCSGTETNGKIQSCR